MTPPRWAAATALLLTATPLLADSPPAPTIQLASQQVSAAGSESTVFGGLLCRELQRQAVLIAARDQLRLPTRDATLNEPFASPSPAALTIAIETHNVRTQRSLVILAIPAARTTDAASPAKSLGRAEFPLDKTPYANYPAFLAAAEKQSRDEFPALLRKAPALASLTPADAPWTDAPASPEALAALRTLTVYSQFTAARLLHAQIHDTGESPARLAALSQAYANLSLLTQPLWNADAKAFAARALLYAQRLTVKDHNSPFALYARAYAFALAGLQRPALDDLAAAQRAHADPPPQPPAWLPAISAFARDNLDDELAAANLPNAGELPHLLAAAIAADGFGIDRTTQLASDALQIDPATFFLSELLFHTHQPDLGSKIPDQALHAIPDALRTGAAPLHLPALAALDDPSLAGDPAAQSGAAMKALFAAAKTDTAEPSLATLASLLSDESFLAATDQLIFRRDWDDQDDDTIKAAADALKPAWKFNPSADYPLSLTAEPESDAQYKILQRFHPHDPGRWTYDDVSLYTDTLDKLERNDGVHWYQTALAGLDLTPFDYTTSMLDYLPDEDDKRALAAYQLNPNSAILFEAWLRHVPITKRREDLPLTEKTVADAQARFPNRPRIMTLAGEWACDVDQFSRGIALMDPAMKAQPSFFTAAPLVAAYLHVNKPQLAKDTADLALALDDPQLKGAQLADDLAGTLLAQHHPQDAWFYAKIALNSDAAWTYNLAAACQEQLGDPDAAADLLHQELNLYPQNASVWYLWAARRHHPSLPDAKAAADAYAAAHPNDPMNAYTGLANNDFHAALKAYAKNEKNFTVDDWVIYTTFAALAHDKHATDLGLLHMETIKSPFGERLADAVQNDRSAWQLDALDVQFQEDWRDLHASDHRQLAAALLAATGHPDLALPLLKRAVHMGHTVSLNYFLVADALTALSQDPDKLAAQPLPNPPDPAPFRGPWLATLNNDAPQSWTLNPDGSVTSTGPFPHGSWTADDRRLLILFAPNAWAVFPLRNAALAAPAKGSSPAGPDTAQLAPAPR
ncbi:MAG TPA: hypothetical protein VH253_07045 [Phycisphaerae bacterium]|nr:hypothetical protein [Phycisphaerae bacterium]